MGDCLISKCELIGILVMRHYPGLFHSKDKWQLQLPDSGWRKPNHRINVGVQCGYGKNGQKVLSMGQTQRELPDTNAPSI
jgi:hypothetical protein